MFHRCERRGGQRADSTAGFAGSVTGLAMNQHTDSAGRPMVIRGGLVLDATGFLGATDIVVRDGAIAALGPSGMAAPDDAVAQDLASPVHVGKEPFEGADPLGHLLRVLRPACSAKARPDAEAEPVRAEIDRLLDGAGVDPGQAAQRQ